MKRLIYTLAILLLLSGCGTAQPTEGSVAPSREEPATQPIEAASAAPTAEPRETQPAEATSAKPPGEQRETPPTEPASAALKVADVQSPAGVLATKLEGLALDEFFHVSFRELVLRDPEAVLSNGLTEIYGVNEVKLTDISDAYIRETQQMYATILEMLHKYDRDQLTPEEQISYDVYDWYLDDRVRQQEFMYYDYPATFFLVTSVPEDLIQFFTDLHPISTLQDAKDYVTRLGQVDTKIDQLLEGLKLREQAGVVPPKFAIQWALYSWRGLANSSAGDTPFYGALEEKLGELADVSAEDRSALLESAQEAISGAVLPAFQALVEYLEHQESVATADDGVWKLPEGEAYYAYTLRHHTTTDLTAEEIHDLGLQDLERIHAEMRAIFDELGYPPGESLAQLFDRVAQEGGHVAGNQVLNTYRSLIEEADRNLGEVFDMRPSTEVIVVGAPYGGYYVSGAYDGSRPGAFYAGVSGSGEDLYSMPSLAYHEAIPGHHWQIAIAQDLDLPAFRTAASFTGYTEGWALYAERLAWELGWYDNDPYGNLGRLQYEAFRAARLVIDTGIHAMGWTFDQAVDFMIENVGYEHGDSVNPEHQIARYIVWPGQATAYKVGMIKILELRQRAMDRLGDRFDIKEFHRVVLSNGAMPLEILERVVDGYIEAKLSSALFPGCAVEGPGSTSIPLLAESRAMGLSEEDVLTLSSLEQVDGYPLYTMCYYGDYDQGISTLDGDGQIVGAGYAAPRSAWACSLFAALGDADSRLLGRNFDWEFSPAVLLFTNPDDGYASVSMVDIAFLGFGGSKAQTVMDSPLSERLSLLDAPNLPFDGMNEQGLAVGMAAVPPGGMQPDPDKETIGSLGVIREMLDHASSVDEALAIVESFNISMDGGPPLHYLIADRSGRSVLVEFYEGEMVVIPNESPWQAATNFLRASASESVEGQCWRYDSIDKRLVEAGGKITVWEAMDILDQVSQDGTQWSIVYGMNSGYIGVAMGRDYGDVYTLNLSLVIE